MMLGLLVYCYAIGVFSSRMIERMTYENVAVRMLCADTHPDQTRFARSGATTGSCWPRASHRYWRWQPALRGAEGGKGDRVAIDGTKIWPTRAACGGELQPGGRADEGVGGGDRGVACEGGRCRLGPLPLEDGLRIPDEVTRRQERRAKLAAARAEMEARADARAQAERAEYEAKLARREEVKVERKKAA